MANLELLLFCTFVTSLVACSILRRLKLGIDANQGVQKVHKKTIARTGGIAIVAAFSFWIYIYFTTADEAKLIKLLFVSIVPIVGSGFIEDITGKVQPLIRLLLSFSSAALFYFLLDVSIQRSDIFFFDELLQVKSYAFILSMLAMAAVLNGTNIIDGLNGLLALYMILVLTILAFVLYQLNDHFYFVVSLFFLFSIVGFVFFVFPFGTLFLGDGGAYFLGIMLAFLVILTVNQYSSVSPWFALLLILYPFFELQWSILRRLIKKQSPFAPDAQHLHSLLYQWLHHRFNLTPERANPTACIIIIACLSFNLTPAIVYFNQAEMLIMLIALFCFVYLSAYFFLSNQTKKYIAQ